MIVFVLESKKVRQNAKKGLTELPLKVGVAEAGPGDFVTLLRPLRVALLTVRANMGRPTCHRTGRVKP